MNKLYPFSLALLLGLAPLAQAQTQAQTQPEETVRGFYAARLASPSIGAPVGSELAEFSRFMSPELVCLLSAALRYNERFYHTYPDEPQPFAESDLYSSASAKPTQFRTGKLSLQGERATVQVHFTLDASGDSPAQEWNDQVELRRISSRWRITDIDYTGGIGHDKPKSLTAKLEERLGSARPVDGWSPRELESCTMDPAHKPAPKAKKSSKSSSAHHGTAKGKAAAANHGSSHSKRASSSKAPAASKAPAKSSSAKTHSKSSAASSKKHHSTQR